MEVVEQQIVLRQGLYRFYAGLLLYPDEDRWQTLRMGAQWLEEQLNNAGQERTNGFSAPTRKLLAWVRELDRNLVDVQTTWTRLFGSSRSGYCYPYEGATLDTDQMALLLGELQMAYARAGLAQATNDLPDHVATELEYMSYLCGLELETLKSDEDERRSRIVAAQRDFLKQHLCRWLPELAKRVAETEGGMYSVACEAAARMAEHEQATLAESAPSPN